MSVFQYSIVRKEQEIIKTSYTRYSYMENKVRLVSMTKRTGSCCKQQCLKPLQLTKDRYRLYITIPLYNL